MKLKNIKKRLLSVILAIAIVLTGTGMSTLANSMTINANSEVEEKTEKEEKEVTEVRELKSEKTENSNTYLMSDGSKKLEIYSEAIRYKKDGVWVDYDATLTNLGTDDKERLEEIVGESADEYTKVNTKGDTKQFFPQELNDKGIVMSKGKYVLSFKPIIEENNKCEEESETTCSIKTQSAESLEEDQNVENTEVTQEVETTDIQDVYTPEVNEDTVIYSSENSSIKYEYISLNSGVKENIILAEKPQNNEFLFDIDSKKIKLVLEEDGSISLKNIKTDKKVGYIMAPNVIDGEGNSNYECIRYELVEADGEVVLKIVIDETYFNNENLKYPVTVDPTALWYGEKLPVAIVNNVTGRSDDVVSSNELLIENNYVYGEGTETRSSRVYIDTSNFIPGNDWLIGNPKLSGKYIENSYLYLSEKSASVNPVLVEVRSVEEAWDSDTITWNNQPEISEELIAQTWNRGIDSRTHGINLTKWIQGIADGSIENNGIVLMAGEEGTQCSYYGTEERISQFMCLDIIYRDIEKYDATITMNAEYNSETGKVQTTLEDGNELAEDVTVKGYKIFARKNNAEKFISIYEGTDISETAELDVSDIDSVVDYRACILYSDGVVKPSNIVTLERYEYEKTEEETTESSSVDMPYFEQTSIDTDGDGLEDGYEIWDLKTLWNTEIVNETSGEVVYNLDTDNDGFPDSYEVFTLGTDPTIANQEGEHSDSDGISDYAEYRNHTDPLIKDSDFDGNDDATEQTDRRKTNGQTDQATAISTNVIKGLYDREYSETEEGTTYTYIQNIYSGNIRQIEYDYGDISLNKTMKYFYDENGNNTAIIEQYDEEYDSKGENLICITYTYDENNNVEFICDQKTNYSMSYNENGEMTSLSVGNQELISYKIIDLLDNNTALEEEEGENEEDNNTEEIAIGTVIEKNQKISTYGAVKDSDGNITSDEGNIRTVTTVYKLAENDVTSAETIEEIYYDGATDISYKIEYTSEGNIKSLYDYTNSQDEPIVYSYTYSDAGISVNRNGEFLKSITEITDESNNTSTITTSYRFKDVKNENITYNTVATIDTSEDTLEENQVVLYNGDISHYTYDSEKKERTRNVYSTLYNSDVFTFTQVEKSNTLTTYDINIYAEDKAIEYTYNLTGNITQISIDGNIKYQYCYDPHGRLTVEKDYVDGKCHEYHYDNDTGNIMTHWICPMNSNGEYSLDNGIAIESRYTDADWPDQLSKYNGNEISYNEAGNPEVYHNGLKFSWQRGRQLSGVRLANNNTNIDDISYKYNENGLRTYKDTPDITTTYEWDETILIRENVTYKATNKTYDIWYFYDNNGEVIGFEYSFINDVNGKNTTRVYYEKDLQGNVIGLLDSRGVEIAKYFYDAWGNITDSMCYQGYEVPFALNHITYRSYYRDEETGFYYLQSRYYDSEICRFINADDVNTLDMYILNVFSENLYCYCNSNPINYVDEFGMLPRWGHLAKGIYLLVLGLNTILKYNKTGFVRTVLSAFSTKVLIVTARAAILLLTLQQYIAAIANVITVISIVLTVKKLVSNIPLGLWHLKQSIWHNHK